MSDFKTCSVCLDTEFVCAPNSEEAACVDLDGDWSEQAKVFRHPEFDVKEIVVCSAEVGEGGDHVNINLKNIGDTQVTIPGDRKIIFIDENPDASDPNEVKKDDQSGQETAENSEEKTTPENEEAKEDDSAVKQHEDENKETIENNLVSEQDAEDESKDSDEKTKEDDEQEAMEVDAINDEEMNAPEESQDKVESDAVAGANEMESNKKSTEENQEMSDVSEGKDEINKINKDVETMEEESVDSDAVTDADKKESLAANEKPIEENEKDHEMDDVSEEKEQSNMIIKDAETAEENAVNSDTVTDNEKESLAENEKITEENEKDQEMDDVSGGKDETNEKDNNSETVKEDSVVTEKSEEEKKEEEKKEDEKKEESGVKATDPMEAKEVSEEKETKDDEKCAEKIAEDEEKNKENEASGDKEHKKSDDDKDKTSDENAAKENDKKSEEKKTTGNPVLMMRFVNETDAAEEESESEEERPDTPEEPENEVGETHTEVQVKEEDQDKKDDDDEEKKPKLKLASIASIQKSPAKEEKKGGCIHCGASVPLKAAVVWEAMQFCSLNCLSTYQTSLSRCSSCNNQVSQSLMGKYCVRFGADIKQFCSNPCLEDHKKGLKVCSYCQKDISGGDGFLAPVGNKGQFKDFCDQTCLNRYDVLNKLKEPEQETGQCQVCQENGNISQHIIRANETIKFCENPSCLSVYKFANKIEITECRNCKKNFETKLFHFPIYSDGQVTYHCSQACQNVAIMINRKIVPCSNCRVKKYNFDMIEVYEDSASSTPNMYCSLHCRTLLKHSEQQSKGGQVPMISDVFSQAAINASVPSLAERQQMPQLPRQPLPPSHLKAAVAGTPLPAPPPLQQMGQLSGPPQLAPVPVAAPPPPPPPQIQIQTQTVTEVVKETKVLPAEVPQVKNKSLQTKPYMVTKAVSCKPMSVSKGTQTDGFSNPTIIPIPVPVHVPTPCAMYNAPFPVPVPIPLPFPVPMFIPTTRNSIKGINKQIKKIINKIPADPFEAELLALAGNIADQDKDSSDSEYDGADGGDDDEMGTRNSALQEPIPDLENEMNAERIIPKPLPISTPEPPPPRQYNFGGYQNNKRGREGEESDDDTWRPQNLFDQRQPKIDRHIASSRRSTRGRTTHQIKRPRTDTVTPAATPAVPQQPKERPDVNHHLKFTYGVNAWKHWVVGKNAELEKQRAQGRYQKSFETDILKLRADELNFTLCMFVKEVKKPNGDSYAADSILYLVLGIQEYLFENGRIDNIFTDVYYDPFTTALHEVVKDFKLPVNELGYFVTRIEEEHLWESKQLGAHSPQVLLNTLVYFNTKYFQLKTADEHLKLSFSHIMKHWKKTTITKSGEQQRTVLLRYYPPPQKGQKNEDRKMYEQHENTDNPLRCPVKLYEFYLSKCPESTKNRNDMFYLQPERSCVPDSPVWYSSALLNKFSMEKMLARLLMVREVQEHMLADQ